MNCWLFYLNEEVDEIWIGLELATERTEKHHFISLGRTCSHFTTDTHQPLSHDNIPYIMCISTHKKTKINLWIAAYIKSPLGILQALMFTSSTILQLIGRDHKDDRLLFGKQVNKLAMIVQCYGSPATSNKSICMVTTITILALYW